MIIEHKVVKGETLYSIGEMYWIYWRKLAKYNKLTNPHLIYPDEIILVPVGFIRKWILKSEGII